MNPLAAFLAAAVFASAARFAGWLSAGGAVAAAAVGGAVLVGAGVAGGLLLGVFFVSGSVLSSRSERAGLHSLDQKGSRRDSLQVLANGTWAGLGALAIPLAPCFGGAVFLGALAAAQADTWATEIGAHSLEPPRLITSGRPAGRGASGAVTALGTVGGLAGAATIAAMGAAVGQPNPAIVAALIGGAAGMLVDSILGATVQGIYLCEACEVETEQPIHRCGRGAALTRGKRWVTNDLVNLAGAGVGAAAGAVSALMCA
jgi:uncharacterized protein (TIGR00297 family)